MLTVLLCCAVCLLLCREFGCVVGESIPVATQGVAVKAREIGRNGDAVENEKGKGKGKGRKERKERDLGVAKLVR